MTRHFGIQSERPAPWGHSGDRPSASLGNYAPSDSILLSTRPALKRGKLSQALIDVSAIGVGVLLVSVMAVSVAGIFFVLFAL